MYFQDSGIRENEGIGPRMNLSLPRWVRDDAVLCFYPAYVFTRTPLCSESHGKSKSRHRAGRLEGLFSGCLCGLGCVRVPNCVYLSVCVCVSVCDASQPPSQGLFLVFPCAVSLTIAAHGKYPGACSYLHICKMIKGLNKSTKLTHLGDLDTNI